MKRSILEMKKKLFERAAMSIYEKEKPGEGGERTMTMTITTE
jgi:hypothetical protein